MEKITEEFLKKFVNALRGWKYHAVLSEENKRGEYFLFNGAGVYVRVCKSYGKKLPQWALGYIEPKRKTFSSVAQVGISVEKSIEAIANDLNNRLLKSTSEVYEKLKNVTEKYQKSAQEKEIIELQYQSLSKVYNLRSYYDRRGYDTHYIENLNNSKTIARISKNQNDPFFTLKIDSISIEKVMEVLQIINE